MQNPQENRVLGRAGARDLTEEELQQISGGVHTNNCSFNPITGTLDGDACGKP